LQKRSANGTTYYILLPSARERKEKTKRIVTRTEKWPVSCNKLGVQYHKKFKEYVDNIMWNEEQRNSSQ